uniref:Glutaredoxin domain-containing protein n=1 Tax=Salix viminalis TaxID=40686 RepID=A0A6N2MGD8_SALVM
MGRNSSKRIEASVDVYLPLFDINSIQFNSIQEPWLVVNTSVREKPSNVLVPILQMLNQFETDAPHSWDEVSEALEDLIKPALNKKRPIATPPPSQKPYTTPTQVAKTSQEKKQEPRNSVSIHTLEELEAKLAQGISSRGKREGSLVHLVERDSVVLYTTSLRGVRETFEDCARVKTLFEVLHVIFDERDVSLHGEILNELRDLTGEVVGVPRVFIKGRCIGGGDEFVELNESGLSHVWDVVGAVMKFKQATDCVALFVWPVFSNPSAAKVTGNLRDLKPSSELGLDDEKFWQRA